MEKNEQTYYLRTAFDRTILFMICQAHVQNPSQAILTVTTSEPQFFFSF